MFNKSTLTNVIALLFILIGYASPWGSAQLMTMGMYAFSGAITNWLAIHMLFEKIPYLYGSGVIPSRFEEFKAGIFNLMMSEFFTEKNIEKFFSGGLKTGPSPQLSKMADIVPYDLLFDNLIEAVKESPMGGMLQMFGGQEALQPVKGPFQEKMKQAIIDMAESKSFQNDLQGIVSQSMHEQDFHRQVAHIVQSRLDQMTPEMVKTVIQNMIRAHLGWLVVWGGVFGALIGFSASFLS